MCAHPAQSAAHAGLLPIALPAQRSGVPL